MYLFQHLRRLADLIETARIGSVGTIAVETEVEKAVSSLVFLLSLIYFLYAHFHRGVHSHVRSVAG